MKCICLLSVVPIRKLPVSSSEMVSSLLFGEYVEVLSKENDWYYIRTEYDDYEGYVNSLQLDPVKPELENFYTIINSPVVVAKSIRHSMFLSIGSQVPDTGKFHIDNHIFHLQDLGQDSNNNNIEYTARKFLNAPYLWGGKSIFGCDCSGFVQTVFKIHNVLLPRDAYQQADIGQKISINDIDKNDLVFFKNIDDRITHVGIMISKGNIIHASGEVRIDMIDEKGIYNVALKKYTHTYALACKVI